MPPKYIPKVDRVELEMVLLQCERQFDFTPKAVADLMEAYCYARRFRNRPIRSLLFPLATLITPKSGAYRQVPVHFPSGSFALDPHLLDRAMENFLDAFEECAFATDEMYEEFEKIHPYEDGNGRMGWLLYLLYHFKRFERWELLDSPHIPVFQY